MTLYVVFFPLTPTYEFEVEVEAKSKGCARDFIALDALDGRREGGESLVGCSSACGLFGAPPYQQGGLGGSI